jgi:hypothetical protein
MAYQTAQVAVTGTAVRVVGPNATAPNTSTLVPVTNNMHRDMVSVDLVNLGGGNVFFGSSDAVTTATGFPILPNTPRSLDIRSGDEVWLVGPAGPNTVAVGVLV